MVDGRWNCLREVGNVLHEPNGQSQEATHGGSACCAVRPGDNVLLCGDASLSGQHNEVCERAGFKPQKSEQMHSDHVDEVCRADIANRSLKLKCATNNFRIFNYKSILHLRFAGGLVWPFRQ